jgi:hypothetical protein
VASIEERVGRLERQAQEDRHTVVAGQGAHSHALSLLHSDLADFRGEMGQFRRETAEQFGQVKTELGEIRRALADIAERLPGGSDQ